MLLRDLIDTILVSSSALDSVSAGRPELPLSRSARGLEGAESIWSSIVILRARADSRTFSIRSLDGWFTAFGASRGLAVFAVFPGAVGEDISERVGGRGYKWRSGRRSFGMGNSNEL